MLPWINIVRGHIKCMEPALETENPITTQNQFLKKIPDFLLPVIDVGDEHYRYVGISGSVKQLKVLHVFNSSVQLPSSYKTCLFFFCYLF